MTIIQSEYEFTLPRGYLDEDHQLHRQVTLRLATGRDDFQASQSPRVAANPRYKGIEMLSRVVLRIGAVEPVHAGVIRGLFAQDYYGLIEEFNRLNYGQQPTVNFPKAEVWDIESDPISLDARFLDDRGQEQQLTARMRAARAEDEILPWGDDRVKENAGFRPYIILSRVLIQLTGLPTINPASLQELPLKDLQTLWKEYNRFNYGNSSFGEPPGESLATPQTSFAGR
ncbi:MAG: hypothetical protein KDA84_15495 [Planctomycetaceae bacterium]|nr:hypothetical protein [Planctomycetaceae bacterium]